MLSALVSNQSTLKILFFLLLNGKCYAGQLSQRFATPLTPLQHALQKLEKGGILLSRYEGKTRYFEFNPHYPLLAELANLLKQAYSLLPTDQKKLYYSPTFPAKTCRTRKNIGPKTVGCQNTLMLAWQKLCQVQTLCFSAKSKSQNLTTGWNGLGKGSVEVKKVDAHTLLFQEKGSWTSEDNKQFAFSNVFRWTLHTHEGAIRLEHLRFGIQNPVFLFALVPMDEHTLESLDAHLCKEDSYFGQLRCDKHFIQLNWRIIGPKKNEEIDYLYT